MVNLPHSVRRRHDPGEHMTAREFRAAIRALGWTQIRARDELAIACVQRINEWANSRRPVPLDLAAAIRAHLQLAECRGVWP